MGVVQGSWYGSIIQGSSCGSRTGSTRSRWGSYKGEVQWHLIDPPSTLDLIGHDCFQIWFSDTQKGLNSTQIFYYKLRQNYCLDLTNHSNELTPTLVSTPGSRMFVDPKPTDCRFPTYNLSTIIGSNQSEDINYDTPKDP